MKIKNFLLHSKNIENSSILWNMAGSMLMAFQSVIMLMILTRTVGLEGAGVFTIAYANANLFLTIGRYGMRNFQVSDVRNRFSFSEYLSSRVISCVSMIAVGFIYTFYTAAVNGYSREKTLIIIWMCLFKVVDAVEDVYNGLYQQKNRLDIAAKEMTIRLMATIFVFAFGLIVLKSLLYSLIISTFVTIALFILFTKWIYGDFVEEDKKHDWKQVIELMKICFPLFAGAFLSFYIGNAPKYAIDAQLTDSAQACYGFIAMPVFVIGLLNNFIFNPMLYRLSLLWSERKVKTFIYKVVRQVGIIFAITIVCIVGAYCIGIPVLSILYNTDLHDYKTELLILLLGGGFLGLSGLLNAVITIIRCQEYLMWGYAIIAVLAFFMSNKIVSMYDVMGASVLYTLLMFGLCIIFSVMLIVGIKKNINEFNEV